MRTLERSGTPRSQLLPDLKKLDRWIPWVAEETDDGETRKVPVHVPEDGRPYRTTYKDIDEWHSYDEARRVADRRDDLDGVQFVIEAAGDDFVVVDIDDCIDKSTGYVDPEVWRHVRSANTYTEISQSGEGLHLVFRGSVPNQGWTAEDDGIDAEVYDKYIVALTEDHVAGTPFHARPNPEWLEAVYENYDIDWSELFF